MNDDRIMRVQYPEVCSLTKREQFAMAAMQGLMGNPHELNTSPRETVEIAIQHADALLAELAKEKV